MIRHADSEIGHETQATNARARMTIPEIARRMKIGRLAVYDMLERGILPGIRIGKRWIVTRHAYEEWERTCGINKGGAKRFDCSS